MKKTVKILAAAVMSAVAAHAAWLPAVGNGTSQNVWTKNMQGVLNAAKTTGSPIFLVMINDSSTGTGCAHCKSFIDHTINTSNFKAIVNDYRFYMVLLNYWGNNGQGDVSEPNYGGVSSSEFHKWFSRYKGVSPRNGDNGYPLVAVIRPNGEAYIGWGHKTSPGTAGTTIHAHIRKAISELAIQDTIFNLYAQSGNTVTVNPDGVTGLVQPGAWSGAVQRSGGSKKTGTVRLAISGANSDRYALSAYSLDFGTEDGVRDFTLAGPNWSDGGIVADTITVSMWAEGFSNSTIKYGTTSQTVTFKDSRVKQTLAEFGASNAGMGGLSSDSGVWYAPAQDDGLVLETMTSGTSEMTFTAVAGGILTVAAGTANPGTISVAFGGASHDLAGGTAEKFGVAPGTQVKFTATANVGKENAVIGFSQFSFTPLVVTQSAPAYGANISYSAMMNDNSLVNLAWGANMPGCAWDISFNGTTRNLGTDTSANAMALGLVPAAPATAAYTWTATAYYTADDLQGTAAASASSTFSIAALPTFGNLSGTAIAYLKINSRIDMSEGMVASGTVTYSAEGLPKNMKINSSTGLITGAPRGKAKTYSVTVTAKNEYGSSTFPLTLKVVKLDKSVTSGQSMLLCFDGSGNVSASAILKLTSAGAWKAKFTEAGGSSTLSGTFSALPDGSIRVSSGSLYAVRDGAGMWYGSSRDRTVYGKAVEKKAGDFWKQFLWNAKAESSSARLGGWISAKVAGNGKASVSGKISDSVKVSSKGMTVMFPAAFVAAYLPRWAGHGDVRFLHLNKKNVLNGTGVLCGDGTVGGAFTFSRTYFDVVEGTRWTVPSLSPLGGATFATSGGVSQSFAVRASPSSISAPKSSANKAKLSAKAKKGTVKASINEGRKQCKASGVLYMKNGAPFAAGGGHCGSVPFVFTISK